MHAPNPKKLVLIEKKEKQKYSSAILPDKEE